MDLLKSLVIVSEKAANVARIIRQDEHLFQLLVQQKKGDEANPRFVDDFKTLADVLIQETVKHDIGNKFPDLSDYIRGEENNTFSNKLGETICVEVKATVEETQELLQKVLNGDTHAAKVLADEVHKDIQLEDVNTKIIPDLSDCNLDVNELGLWIDPIDSTAEYINGTDIESENGIYVNGLKCVTVLIGVFNRNRNIPVFGVVNQPFSSKCEDGWRGHCLWGVCLDSTSCSSLQLSPDRSNIICLSSSENEEVKMKLKEKGFKLVEASGAGYKILTVITGLADAYVLSKNSTFKWDTCGPHAILKSLKGDIIIYKDALTNKKISVEYSTESDPNKFCNLGGIIAYRNENVLADVLECL